MIVHTARLFPEDFQRRYVLLYLQGPWHLQLCRHMFSELPDIEWVVCIEADGSTALKLSEAFEAPSNVTYIHRLHDVYLRLDAFSAVISTWAVPHRAHAKGIQLYNACAQLGIPVFELQHGLFQVGVSYRERGRIVGDGYYGAVSALAVSNFHDHLLGWWGEEAIGYPANINLPKPTDKGYVLILSNMHWNIYGEIDQMLFFESVKAMVGSNPEINFIWKPHPGEISKRTEKYFKPLMDKLLPNITLMTNADMSEQALTTEDLIKGCTVAISTFSTVLLDLEMYGKDILLYAPAVCQGLRDQIKTCSTFTTPGQLLKQLPRLLSKKSETGVFVSGMLEPFRPDILREKLKAYGRKTRPAKADLARVIAPMLNKLLP